MLNITDLGSENKISGPFTPESLRVLAKSASKSLGVESGDVNFKSSLGDLFLLQILIEGSTLF